jgi:hypothetical protein
VYRGNILGLRLPRRWRRPGTGLPSYPYWSASERERSSSRHHPPSPSDTAGGRFPPAWASLLVALTLATAARRAGVGHRGRQLALVDQWERTVLRFGQPVDDARYAELQA